jgi:hypothetical protein
LDEIVMPHQPKRKSRTRRQPVYQDSPFLRLPGEVRTLIYNAALVKPGHIDLWPAKYLKNVVENPHIADRLAKLRNGCVYCKTNYPNASCEHVWDFRYQEDLEYVRKQLATGLLATCQQISQEAFHIFWGENSFRFTRDRRWATVRRFLSTIGPRAVSQLHSLEVFAPVPVDSVNRHGLFETEQDMPEAKNFPKLHMNKAGKNLDVEQNSEVVLQLLREAGAHIDLRFIVSYGFVFNHREENWFSDRVRTTPLQEPHLHMYNSVLSAGPRSTKSMTLVLEAGAHLNTGPELLENLTLNGIGVISQPGSFYSAEPGIDVSPEEIKELKRWQFSLCDFDYLSGVSDLFEEAVGFSSPGRGGKANKRAGSKNVARQLKAFGGCRFVTRDGADCINCWRTIIYVRKKAVQSCKYCGANFMDQEDREVIELKTMEKAMRTGEVNGRMITRINA